MAKNLLITLIINLLITTSLAVTNKNNQLSLNVVNQKAGDFEMVSDGMKMMQNAFLDKRRNK